jgi:CRISPR-associated protein Cas6/Cse3/CasE subtype I-E
MHATLIRIPPKEVRELGLSDRYQIHKYLWAVHFSDRKERDFLYKVKTYDGKIGLTLLVLSKEAPLPSAHTVRTKEVRGVFQGSYAYHVVVNPTKKVKGKIVALTKEEDVRAWWEGKATVAGFSVCSCTLQDLTTKHFYKGGVWGTLVGATLTGTLTVQDCVAFKEAMLQGVGRGKSLGFGLLEIGM